MGLGLCFQEVSHGVHGQVRPAGPQTGAGLPGKLGQLRALLHVKQLVKQLVNEAASLGILLPPPSIFLPPFFFLELANQPPFLLRILMTHVPNGELENRRPHGPGEGYLKTHRERGVNLNWVVLF